MFVVLVKTVLIIIISIFLVYILSLEKSCPKKKWFSVLSSVGAVSGVPVGVFFLRDTSIYCACLDVVLVDFGFSLDQPDGYLVGKELVILLLECVVGKMFCYVLCIFFTTWCLCWDLISNCIDS